MQEAQNAGVDQPRHGDGRYDQREFHHRAPRFAAFEPPRAAGAPGFGPACGHAREEVDADEYHGTGHERSYRGEKPRGGGEGAANVFRYSFHVSYRFSEYSLPDRIPGNAPRSARDVPRRGARACGLSSAATA